MVNVQYLWKKQQQQQNTFLYKNQLIEMLLIIKI